MKVNGGGSNLPLDAQKAAKAKDIQKEEVKSQGAKVIDSVDARLSRALKAVEDEIYSTGLTAGEVHSNLDENRVANLLRSMENVEAKGPSLDADSILALTDRLAGKMSDRPQEAMKAHGPIEGSRVLELTESV